MKFLPRSSCCCLTTLVRLTGSGTSIALRSTFSSTGTTRSATTTSRPRKFLNFASSHRRTRKDLLVGTATTTTTALLLFQLSSRSSVAATLSTLAFAIPENNISSNSHQQRTNHSFSIIHTSTSKRSANSNVESESLNDVDSTCIMSSSTGYLNAQDAAALDEELMTQPGFTLEQLMELAGLSVAEAVYDSYPPSNKEEQQSQSSILIVCGPGNNGGDGLVAARHLKHFGYHDIKVVYPKRSSKTAHYGNLVVQCEDMNIPILDEMPSGWKLQTNNLIVIDAMFGFSFKGEPREPFKTILNDIIELNNEGKIKVVSVDVPSGWNVDEGDVLDTKFMPNVLVSLTTPKRSAKQFTGDKHYVGGRFLPPALANKYNIQMPPYQGVKQIMEVPILKSITIK